MTTTISNKPINITIQQIEAIPSIIKQTRAHTIKYNQNQPRKSIKTQQAERQQQQQNKDNPQQRITINRKKRQAKYSRYKR